MDSWLPMAVFFKRAQIGNPTIVFPYFWILDRISMDDALLKIISKNNFEIGFRLFPLKRYMKVQSIEEFKRITESLVRVRKPFTSAGTKQLEHLSATQWCSALVVLFKSIRSSQKMRFSHSGMLVWDLLNLGVEPQKKLKYLLRITKSWTRVSINVGTIYIEEPNLRNFGVSDKDVVFSFSPSQSIRTQIQYGLPDSQIIHVSVPKYNSDWIRQLEIEQSVDFGQLDEYVLLVSRGADPPLLPSSARLDLLTEVIDEVCNVRRLRLFIKLHPNEDKSSFLADLEKVGATLHLSPETLALVCVTNDHVLTVARNALFGIAFYSSTIADMVRVGCPTIQFLKILNEDAAELKRKKRMFDFGFAEIAISGDSFRSAVQKICDDRTGMLDNQTTNWKRYFYDNHGLEPNLLLEEFALRLSNTS